MPDLPTVAETPGFAGYEVTSWIGLVGPAGLPRAVVDSLNGEINRVLARPDIRDKLAELGRGDGTRLPRRVRRIHSPAARQLADEDRCRWHPAGIARDDDTDARRSSHAGGPACLRTIPGSR